MWKSKLEKAQAKEIEFLREQLKTLTLQIIALSGKGAEYLQTKIADTKTDAAKQLEKKIENMPALTPEDQQKKDRALRLARKTLAGA